MTAKSGDKVKVHYKGTLDDGSVFDSSEGRAPLEFQIGSGQVIAGFDEGVSGMAVGEKKKVHIPAAQAYGEHNPEMVADFPRDQMPADLKPEIGQKLQMMTQQGQPVMVTVTKITDKHVSLDANHELAGKALNFELELVSID